MNFDERAEHVVIHYNMLGLNESLEQLISSFDIASFSSDV